MRARAHIKGPHARRLPTPPHNEHSLYSLSSAWSRRPQSRWPPPLLLFQASRKGWCYRRRQHCSCSCKRGAAGDGVDDRPVQDLLDGGGERGRGRGRRGGYALGMSWVWGVGGWGGGGKGRGGRHGLATTRHGQGHLQQLMMGMCCSCDRLVASLAWVGSGVAELPAAVTRGRPSFASSSAEATTFLAQTPTP